DMTGRMPPGFSQVSVGTESISFAPGSEAATSLPGMDGGAIGLGPIGDQMSSLIQSVMQMPGPMGLLSQLFQFLSSLFSSMLKALDPSMLAQQAQGALDLKKLMQR
ncbi:hypothetical protein, partial [Lacticaseibacillus paracasei]|uniref:hypothetical protein n=1 Tax=Lacticaseibacillus paracasei TaxID=1597 RepID=UPI001ED9695F